MSLRNRDYKTDQLREMAEGLVEAEAPDCWGCFHRHGQQGEAEFLCLVCGELSCRLCVDLHAREAHPLPYEARVRAEMAGEERARSLFAIVIAFAAMAGLAILLWPVRERFFELYREPRVMAAISLLGGTCLVIWLGRSVLGRRGSS